MNNPNSTVEQGNEMQDSLKERHKRFWEEYNARVPTDAEAWAELLGPTLRSVGETCSTCSDTNMECIPNTRMAKCRTCKKKQSLTAGTFFNNIRAPRAWLAAIRMLECKIPCNASDFYKEAGVWYSTAWNIFRKLGLVAKEHMPETAELVDSRHFAEVIGRRSRETPAREQPIAEISDVEMTSEQDEAETRSSRREEETNAGSRAGDEAQTQTTGSSDSRSDEAQRPAKTGVYAGIEKLATIDNENVLLDWLSDEPLHFDRLQELVGTSTGHLAAVLTMLEMKGKVRSLPGDWYVRITEKTKGSVDGRAGGQALDRHSNKDSWASNDTIAFLRDTFQGIARKYLQPYLAIYWCLRDEVRWARDALLNACQLADPITEDQVLAYVSPASIRVARLTKTTAPDPACLGTATI